MDILRNQWPPSLRTRTIILSVQSLLSTPDADDFLNQEAAKLYIENKDKYNDVSKEYTYEYANYSIFKKEVDRLGVKNIISI